MGAKARYCPFCKAEGKPPAACYHPMYRMHTRDGGGRMGNDHPSPHYYKCGGCGRAVFFDEIDDDGLSFDADFTGMAPGLVFLLQPMSTEVGVAAVSDHAHRPRQPVEVTVGDGPLTDVRGGHRRLRGRWEDDQDLNEHGEGFEREDGEE